MSWLSDELILLTRARYGLVLIVTHEEDRALRAASEACQALGLGRSVWSASRGLEGSNVSALDAVQHHARQQDPGVMVMLDMLPLLADDPVLTRHVREMGRLGLSRGRAVWLISPRSDLPPELEKEISVVDLPLPTGAELREGLELVCAEQGVLFDMEFIDALTRAAGGLTLDEAQRVFRKALVGGGGHLLNNVDIIIEEKRRILRRGTVLEAQPLEWSLDDVGGLDELKRWLRERERAFSEDARAFGLPEPRGLLLMGVQGCGKSLSAKAVASLWRLPLLRLDLSALFGTSSPEAELRRALKVAEAMSPDVLWIDELDKGFDADPKGQAARVLGTIVTWLQEKHSPVFVVATANEVEGLPPELTRRGRFDAVFFVDLPDVHERLEILTLHLRRHGRPPEGYRVTSLAENTAHFVGSELEQVVVGGLYRAFAERRELSQDDLEAEAIETVPLYSTYEEQIKKLRQWAKGRARPASMDRSKLDLFAGKAATKAQPPQIETSSQAEVFETVQETTEPGDTLFDLFEMSTGMPRPGGPPTINNK
jgi:AAA+ superfamily predicted ATPase